MTYIPNSIEARDIASLVHMQTNLRQHQQDGPLLIVRGEGCRVFDDSGRDYIEAIAGLWCASLGFASSGSPESPTSRCASSATTTFIATDRHEPAVALAETLLKIAPVPMARVVFQCSGLGGERHRDQACLVLLGSRSASRSAQNHRRRMGYHGNTCAA